SGKFGLGKLLSADRRDGAADSVALQDPVETFLGVNAVVEGDFDDLLCFFAFLEFVVLKRPRHRFRLADHPVIGPGAWDVTLFEIQFPDMPACFSNRLFIRAMHTLRKRLRRLGRNRRDSKLVSLLQEERVEEAAVFLLGPKEVTKLIDGRWGTAFVQGPLELFEVC